jgi:hypothetical protein
MRANLTDIGDLESRIGLRVPEDYKLFLSVNNGGKCISGGDFRDGATGKTISSISVVLGLRDQPNYSIEVSLRAWKDAYPRNC